MDRDAGMLIPAMVTGSDSISVSGATFVCVAKLKASGVVSGLQPCSSRTATNNSASSGRNDFFNFCTRLSSMTWRIGIGEPGRDEAGFLSAPGDRAIAVGPKHIFKG